MLAYTFFPPLFFPNPKALRKYIPITNAIIAGIQAINPPFPDPMYPISVDIDVFAAPAPIELAKFCNTTNPTPTSIANTIKE